MLNNLQNLFSNTKLENSSKISKSLLKLIAQYLSLLKKTNPSWYQQALIYVVDGSDSKILATFSKTEKAGQALFLEGCDHHIDYEKEGDWERADKITVNKLNFIQKMEKAPLVVLLRLAELFESAARKEREKPSNFLKKLKAPIWFQALTIENSSGLMFLDEEGCSYSIFIYERLLELDEADPSIPARALLLIDDNDWEEYQIRTAMGNCRDIKNYLEKYPLVVREALQSKFGIKIQAINLLEKHQIDATPYIDLLLDAAVGTAKTVRQVTEPMVMSIGKKAVELLQSIAIEGSPGERGHAIRLLWNIQGDKVKAFLEKRKAEDKSNKVKQIIERLFETTPSAVSGDSEDKKYAQLLKTLEPIEKGSIDDPLNTEFIDRLKEILKKFEKKAQQRYEKEKKRDPECEYLEKPDKLNYKHLDKFQYFLVNYKYQPKEKIIEFSLPCYRGLEIESDFKKLIESIQLTPIQFIRLMIALGLISIDEKDSNQCNFYYRLALYLSAYRRCYAPKMGLSEFAVYLEQIGLDPESVGQERLSWGFRSSGFDLEPELVWPYFVRYQDVLKRELNVIPGSKNTNEWDDDDRKIEAFKILAMFPVLPSIYESKCWEESLSETKRFRLLAQDALHTVADKNQIIIKALGDGKQAIRVAAAEWLGRLEAIEAIEPLQVAFETEKQDFVKGVFLKSLEVLGADINHYIDREKLLKESIAGLKKALPKGLSWFQIDLLPKIHWQDTNKIVDPKIIQWLIIQNCKFKTPEPGALLLQYGQMFKTQDRYSLGKYIFDAWISHDTRRPSETDVADQCRQDAKQYAKYYEEPEDKLYQMFLKNALNQCIGSAIGEKGLLAVVAACANPEIVGDVESYIRYWYGQRTAQCKALLTMLSWIDDSSAIQVLLSIATRFRTASIRNEADVLSKKLAERRNWTIAELADRTIPVAGFDQKSDASPVQLIDYGERQFTVTLDDHLNSIITNPEGKIIKSLPAARKDEDEALVKAAKRELTKSKKELKSVVKLQSERLYEAMCVQRSWSINDWNIYLANHPIVSKLCQRMIWTAVKHKSTENKDLENNFEYIISFRPLEDGSLTDVEDNAVSLPNDCEILVGHDCNTPEQQAKAWLEHIKDYELDVLFEQYGKKSYLLDEKLKDDTQVSELEGHMIEAYKLRSRLLKLGYSRGQAEDGGFFYTYHKLFPTLEIEAVIEFSGNVLPEENINVALRNLSFRKHASQRSSYYDDEPGGNYDIALKNIPEVVLSESWNDINSVATIGTGYEPEWESKLEW